MGFRSALIVVNHVREEREKVELVKPFFMWHDTEASHLPCCKVLNPLQVVNVDFQIRELASIAYSRCGRAIEQYSGIMSALDRSANSLVAFAAPR